ncbi:MAG: protein Mom [Firmicutes bacterium]|nr:protein Mom [Bacillota bacterium]
MPDKQKPDLLVDWCSYEAAKYAVEHWHYSGTMPTSPTVRIGVWENRCFIGAVIFSRGACKNLGTSYGLQQTEVCELARVALSAHLTPTSRIVACALKMLVEDNARLRLVVSFADANEGHLGVLYQAGNWVYCGETTASCKWRDARGRLWHSRQVSKTGWRVQYGKMRQVPATADCVRITQLPKHRYLYPLDKAMRRRIEPLRQPYPKRESVRLLEGPQLPAEVGGAEPTRTLQQAGE